MRPDPHAGLRARAVGALAGVAIGAFGMVAPRPAAATDIWFGAVTNQPTPRGFETNPDYPELFADQPRWPRALAHVRAMKVVRRYVMSAPEPELRRVFAFLRRRNIAVAAVFGMVTAEGCGKRVEGMEHNPRANRKTAERLRELGADVRYIVADEPLTFGHYHDKGDACRFSIEETAATYADNIREVKSVFPNATVVDTEATSVLNSPEDLAKWFDLLKEKLGPDAPSVLHLDVQWPRDDWKGKVGWIISTAKSRGIGYGIIYHGTARERSDEAYMAAVKASIVAWEQTVREPPMHVVIQSWTEFPSHVLPEDDPNALTSLVNWFCEHSTVVKDCR